MGKLFSGFASLRPRNIYPSLPKSRHSSTSYTIYYYIFLYCNCYIKEPQTLLQWAYFSRLLQSSIAVEFVYNVNKNIIIAVYILKFIAVEFISKEKWCVYIVTSVFATLISRKILKRFQKFYLYDDPRITHDIPKICLM
jgi:hypothetical protein